LTCRLCLDELEVVAFAPAAALDSKGLGAASGFPSVDRISAVSAGGVKGSPNSELGGWGFNSACGAAGLSLWAGRPRLATTRPEMTRALNVGANMMSSWKIK
jgi:hypothetical protein